MILAKDNSMDLKVSLFSIHRYRIPLERSCGMSDFSICFFVCNWLVKYGMFASIIDCNMENLNMSKQRGKQSGCYSHLLRGSRHGDNVSSDPVRVDPFQREWFFLGFPFGPLIGLVFARFPAAEEALPFSRNSKVPLVAARCHFCTRG